MSKRPILGLTTVLLAVAASIGLIIALILSTPEVSASRLDPTTPSTDDSLTLTLTPTATVTATPCPTGKFPIVEGTGCGTPTATPTSQHPDGCTTPTPGSTPTNTPGGPTPTSTPTGTPCSVPTTAAPTETPCPTDKAPSFPPGSGCGTFTPTPTPVPLPPMLTIDFTVNGAQDSVMILQGQFISINTAYHNDDHRGITIDDTVDLTNGGGHSVGHCYISPGSSCKGASGFSADYVRTMTATLRLTAQVQGCGLCPALEKEHSIAVAVIGRGDFNCGGGIDAVDAALILQLSAALIQPFDCSGAGDTNRDGNTNAIDAFLLLQYVAGLITGFP